jgi:hypothetical protein
MPESCPDNAQQTDDRFICWVSPVNAAILMGVSVRTIRRQVAASNLTATRLPSPRGKGRLRIRLNILDFVDPSNFLSGSQPKETDLPGS